jgi:competence protein ComEC
MMVVSHHDSDHYGGMESLLMQIPTNQLLASFDLPIDVNRQLGFSQRCVQGQSWFWDGVKFEVLYPDEDLYHQAEVSDNNRSCVLRVSNASGSLLLTGDIELQAERRLLESQQKIQSTLMTIPHHGSKTSSSQALIDAVKPRWAIATVGYMNRYHHPRADIMQRYQ